MIEICREKEKRKKENLHRKLKKRSMKCNHIQGLKQRSNNEAKAEKLFNWGAFSGERAFLLASKICQRNQQPFPLCLCLSLPNNVSVTLEH